MIAAALSAAVGFGAIGGSPVGAQDIPVVPYSISHNCISSEDGSWRWDCKSGDWPVYFVSFYLPNGGPIPVDMYVSIENDYGSVMSSSFIRTKLAPLYGLDGRLARNRPYSRGTTKTFMFFGWRLWGGSEDQYLPVTLRANSSLTGGWIVEAGDYIYLPAGISVAPCPDAGCGGSAGGGKGYSATVR